jgi:transposase
MSHNYKADRLKTFDGPPRIRLGSRATVDGRATPPEAEAIKEGRAEARRGSPLLRWHSVVASQRSKCDGSSSAVPAAHNVLASTAGVGARRGLARPLEEVSMEIDRDDVVVGREVQRRDVFNNKKRNADIVKTKRGKRTKLMVVADGRGIPLGVHIAPASPAEVTMIGSTLDQAAVMRSGLGRARTKRRRLIYEKAADSDALRLRLKKRGVELICPYRSNRKRPVLQDSRSHRRCRRCWTIERTVAWLGNNGRLVVRCERTAKIFMAFLKTACLIITLRQFGNHV